MRDSSHVWGFIFICRAASSTCIFGFISICRTLLLNWDVFRVYSFHFSLKLGMPLQPLFLELVAFGFRPSRTESRNRGDWKSRRRREPDRGSHKAHPWKAQGSFFDGRTSWSKVSPVSSPQKSSNPVIRISMKQHLLIKGLKSVTLKGEHRQNVNPGLSRAPG